MMNRIRIVIHAEVEIPVASNWRPVSDKTLIDSILVLITVSSNVSVFYSTLGLK